MTGLYKTDDSHNESEVGKLSANHDVEPSPNTVLCISSRTNSAAIGPQCNSTLDFSLNTKVSMTSYSRRNPKFRLECFYYHLKPVKEIKF